MIAAWYSVVSGMLILYVVLDGRNFGAGMLHWCIAKTPAERRQVIAAIGPLWSWHEVWLLAFGGTLLAIFPRLMASAFAGYYLALFLILWCLILRGASIEVGGHFENRLWQSYWDFHFTLSSFLLALLFGAAAGNVARGVPLDAHGKFAMAFFTNFSVRGNVGLLDWYTVPIAISAVVILAAHGATYLTLKTAGVVHDRCQEYATRLWIASIPLLLVILIESRFVRPDLPGRALFNPFCWIGLIVIAASAFMLLSGLASGRELRAFVGSNLLIVGLLGTGAAAIFPVMLHSTLAPENSLTAYAVASNPTTLRITAIWWPIGCALTVSYSILIARRYAGKVGIERDNENSHQGAES
jgi:cytochrome d ubiquinol oxidase subunit II